MVYGGDSRKSDRLDPEEPVGKALVVMKNVVIGGIMQHEISEPDARGERFRKPSAGHTEPLHQVYRRRQFLQRRHPEEIVGIIQIKAGKFVEPNVVIHYRVWRA